MERVVNRSELVSEDEPSAPSSPDVERSKILKKFDFVQRAEFGEKPEEATPEDAELEFVLFAPSTGIGQTAEGVAKIRIQTPPTEGEPGFVVPSRHSSYYFANPPTDQAKDALTAAAVSGRDVVARSRSLWPGSTYEWKALHIPISKRQQHMLSAVDPSFARLSGGNVVPKRRRPGKQARLKVRKKLATAKAQQDEKQKAAELRDAADREKRTRRNREKKVKKKQRDKAKKVEVGTDNSISTPD